MYQLPTVVSMFTRLEVADEFRKWGTHLWVPSDIDGPRLLWALSGCESSFGANCTPRHEAIYCTGRYSQSPEVVQLTKLYGHGAHCSYGPLQILLVNCIGASPQDMSSLSRAVMESAGFINRRILKAQGAKTVAEIADAYNSGTWRDQIIPEKYIAYCQKYYDSEPMPAGANV
jgi:hypothetical protein